MNNNRHKKNDFDPNKSYSIGVWDLIYYVVDNEDGDYVRNEDGGIKRFRLDDEIRMFCTPYTNYSYLADGLEVDHLEEVDNDNLH